MEAGKTGKPGKRFSAANKTGNTGKKNF